MLLSGNSILLFFITFLKKLENQTYISLLLELISNWIDMCLGIRKPEAMAINTFSLTWNTMISTCSTFQSCRLDISDDLKRQGKCSDSCTRLVNPYWYLQVLQMTNQDLLYLWLTLRNFDIAIQNLQVSPAMQKKKKKIVNSNQSNYTTENYLHIASITNILNNGYLILKIYVMY